MLKYFCLASKMSIEIIKAKHWTYSPILGLELPELLKGFEIFLKKFKDLEKLKVFEGLYLVIQKCFKDLPGFFIAMIK